MDDNRDFYVFYIPTFETKSTRQPLKSNTTPIIPNKGCKDWADCYTCPKPDCDWLPCRKSRTRRKYHTSTPIMGGANNDY